MKIMSRKYIFLVRSRPSSWRADRLDKNSVVKAYSIQGFIAKTPSIFDAHCQVSFILPYPQDVRFYYVSSQPLTNNPSKQFLSNTFRFSL